MNKQQLLNKHLRVRPDFGTAFAALIILANGLFIIAFSLLSQLSTVHALRLSNLSVDVSLAIGLGLIYLSSQLRRRKWTAWLATAVVYIIYLAINLETLIDYYINHRLTGLEIFRAIILPGAILVLLIFDRQKYVVRSDGPGFRAAIRLSLIILIVAFIYGAAGFLLLAKADFHQHLSIPAAMHYTIDQIGLTTNHPIHAYSRRAKLFLGSLSFISIAAIVYVIGSFFQPLRSRFGDQSPDRQRFKELILTQHDAKSEDYFKLWPPDKQYFFDSTAASGLAYHVYHGVALVLGGPAGKQARFKQLLSEFQYLCYGNDWRPAIIHCEETNRLIYEDLGYGLQKIGQEAVVDLNNFNTNEVKNKYFRNIVNKFAKQNYSVELLSPPHSRATLDNLRLISNDWLSSGNRAERGFAMGYFSDQYLNQCEVMVAKDAKGTILAFINLIPAMFDEHEATYDLLRYSSQALGNINDYLLMNLCRELEDRGYSRINLGFCPLAGIEGDDKNSGLIDSVLGFAYANGDRFYSFSGLYRFKNKYSPVWRDRYIAYQGGIRGFSKAANALVQTMRRTAGR